MMYIPDTGRATFCPDRLYITSFLDGFRMAVIPIVIGTGILIKRKVEVSDCVKAR